MTNNNTSLTILSTTIRQDDQGRYCLNDCHKASGGESNKAPSEWVKNKQTKALADELGASGNSPTPLNVLNDGKNNGTYASEEMVLAYAMWISPKFHAECLRSLLAMMKGQMPSVSPKPKRIRKPAFDTAFSRCMNVVALLPNVDENQKVLMAARGTHTLTGINPLEVMGYAAFPAATEDNYQTPTQLGKPFGLPPRRVNRILVDAGLQVHTPGSSTGSDWSMTDKGLAYGKMFDTSRRGGKGSQQQLKWKPSVAEFLRPFSQTPA